MANLEQNTSLEKATILMKSAIKKYETGDYESAEKDREQANYLYSVAKEEANTTDYDSSKLYNESYNFGIIYKVFEENVKTILKEKKDNKPIAQIVKAIKNNKILKEQFDVYNTLMNTVVSSDIDTYLNEALTLIPSFDKEEVIKTNRKLAQLIRKNNMNECIEINDDNINIYEAIEFLMFNKKNLSNLDEYNVKKQILKEHIVTNSTLTENVNSITEKDYNNDLNNVLNQLDENLNEDEKALLSELSEGNNKHDVFKKYKKDTIEFICEQISATDDTNEKLDWNNVLTRISLKEFNEHTLLEDIISFVNIQNIIAE